jgi:hypothetical protein
MRLVVITAVAASVVAASAVAQQPKPSPPQTACACQRMSSCWGSWVNLSYAQLRAACDGASPVKRIKNECDKLDRLMRR